MDDSNFKTFYGRTTKNLIELPSSWEDEVDLSTLSVHLTEVGANQNLIIKRVQGLQIHLQTNGLPVDCYYFVIGELLDEEE